MGPTPMEPALFSIKNYLRLCLLFVFRSTKNFQDITVKVVKRDEVLFLKIEVTAVMGIFKCRPHDEVSTFATVGLYGLCED